MNDAFIAMQWRDELQDTLYFAGYPHAFTREVVRGKKAYIFKNDAFCVTVVGKSITIDDVKFKTVRDAKRHICERWIR